MKTKVVILAATALLLVSCGREIVERPGDESVDISFTAGGFTRGSEITGPAGMATAGFCVWAYNYTGFWASAASKTIIINNTGLGHGRVTSGDGGLTWSYGTPQMWPGNRVSFFAYAPYGAATPTGVDGQGVPTISYTIPDNVANQVDLLIADHVLDRIGPTPVNEMFRHALSRVSFSALKSANVSGVVKVTSIEVRNIYNDGSTVLKTPVLWNVNNLSTGAPVITIVNGLLQNLALTTTVQNVLSPGGTMFLMPQTLDATAEIVVTYTIDALELSWTSPIPSPSVWEAGKSYNYQLLIDTDLVMVILGQLESPWDGPGWGNY